MSKPTEILAKAASEQLCNVVVIGLRPDRTLYIDHSGTTVASLMMYCDLAKDEAMKAWHEASNMKDAAE